MCVAWHSAGQAGRGSIGNNNSKATGSLAEGQYPNPDSEITPILPDFNLFKEIFSPVEHSIPLDTLINIHFMFIFFLFIIVFCLILLVIFFLINLIILLNKDYFLNKVKNKYALLYIKYVIFKSRVDLFITAIIIIVTLCFILYILHYLIVHPIIINN